GLDIPEIKVLEDPFYDLLVLDESNDAHFALASLAGKGIHFINLLDQPCPVLCTKKAELI
ncbi:MAG: hypothetical protein NTV82_02385, partial [Candidatus Aminicenantes bacterium]|nr:hypothetical protein [Candidatus Aminicenantes bacterium]